MINWYHRIAVLCGCLSSQIEPLENTLCELIICLLRMEVEVRFGKMILHTFLSTRAAPHVPVSIAFNATFQQPDTVLALSTQQLFAELSIGPRRKVKRLLATQLPFPLWTQLGTSFESLCLLCRKEEWIQGLCKDQKSNLNISIICLSNSSLPNCFGLCGLVGVGLLVCSPSLVQSVFNIKCL